MRKNTGSQVIGAQLVSATDGSAFTGSVTVSVTGDAGTQATGSVGSGACTHEGNGYHTYAPAQAETNYDLIAFTFTGTGAVPVTVQVFTVSYNRHDTVRLGLTSLPNAAADAAGGLVISDAGGLDIDAKLATATSTLATSAELTTVLEAVGDIGGASGALAYEATTDNTGGAIESVTFAGTQTGTFANVESENGVYHQIDHATNAIDIVYEFAVGTNSTATECAFRGYLNGSNDTLNIQAYDFVGADWETIRVLTGQGGSGNLARDLPLLVKHTGTGADDGRVLIRFVTTGQTAPVLYVDQVIVNAVTTPITAADLPTNFSALGIESDGDITKVNLLDGHTVQTGDTYALANGATGFTAIDTVVDAILVDTGTTIPATLAGLNDPSAATIASTVAGYSTGLASANDGSWLGAVLGVIEDTGTTIPATIATAQADLDVITGSDGVTLATAQGNYAPATPAQVNAEVVDALNVDSYPEPGQGTPAATTSLAAKIGYLYKNWRNRKTQTATSWELMNDDATTTDQKATVADDGTTASKTEIESGP